MPDLGFYQIYQIVGRFPEIGDKDRFFAPALASGVMLCRNSYRQETDVLSFFNFLRAYFQASGVDDIVKASSPAECLRTVKLYNIVCDELSE